MSKINEVRLMIEKEIDAFLKDPSGTEDTSKFGLIKLGIEPNLETVLGFWGGFLLGRSFSILGEVPDDLDPFFELIKRRSWELRQARAISIN